jgi:hypothetical protein
MEIQTPSQTQADLALKIFKVCQGHNMGDGVVALVIVMRMLLHSWPEKSRVEILAGVIKDLKSVVLKHHV